MSPLVRLGKCEVCNDKAIYTCPKCEVKTCCLKCLNIHKKEFNCDGIRDRTKYIPSKNITEMDFMNDYKFLEECTNYVQERKSDKIKHYTTFNKTLPNRLFKLRNLCRSNKITLRFLLENFSKHKINTTRFDWKTKVISWRIDWIFTNAGNLKYVDELCSENEILSKLLDKYLNRDSIEEIPLKKSLEYYQGMGLGNLRILLKSEGIKKCKTRFYELNCKKTLKENLCGKTIVEYPEIHLCYGDVIEEYDVIDSDEDIDEEINAHNLKLNEFRKQLQMKSEGQIKKEKNDLKVRKLRQERQRRREKLKMEPQNYLFGNEELNELESNSESSATEEDTEICCNLLEN